VTPVSSGEFVSTSLDQTVCVWRIGSGQHQQQGQPESDASRSLLKCSLPPPKGVQEPVHCVQHVRQTGDLALATAANRIVVRRGPRSAEAAAHVQIHKLRSDAVKGNLTSFRVLAMNKTLLIGQDSGAISLIC